MACETHIDCDNQNLSADDLFRKLIQTDGSGCPALNTTGSGGGGGGGDATAANQVTGNNSLASIDAGIPAALGQTTMAASMPVTIASDQSTLATGGNFAIGTNLRRLGFPGTFPGALTIGYEDIGAADRKELGIPFIIA